MKIPHHRRIRMRSQDTPQQIMRGPHIRDPIPHRLVDRILQCFLPGINPPHLSPQQPHAKHIQLLPPHVLRSHIDDALKPKQRTYGRRSHPMLPGASLRNNPLLPHAPRQQRLPQAVINLVRTRVQQIFPLQINLRSAQILRQPLRKCQRRGPTSKLTQQPVQLLLKSPVLLRHRVGHFQFLQGGHQGLRHIAPAILPKPPRLRGLSRCGAGVLARVPCRPSDRAALQTSPLSRNSFLGHQRSRSRSRSAPLTAATNALTFSASFRPGSRSTPETTSTPQGSSTAIIPATFSGVNPPATTTGKYCITARTPVQASSQLNAPPVPFEESANTALTLDGIFPTEAINSPAGTATNIFFSVTGHAPREPCNCTADTPASSATSASRSGSSFKNTPTVSTLPGNRFTIPRTRCAVTKRGLLS